MSEAQEAAVKYILACSDPFAAEVDPYVEGIGGHLHMATISEKEGFHWVMPPKLLRDG